ncbi:MAG TPA: hypothetical protein VNP98_07025 [Chthoniobacterales bacterium]|nr:hypothetical protein [Chthoniobacterales bacterium]
MTASPLAPRLLKGALVSVDPTFPIPQVIVFQYNPETLTRQLKARGPQGDAGRGDTTRLNGAPEETIKIDVELDATDQLEKGEGVATAIGIYPQLSALEMLIYPKSALVIANTVLAAAGLIEISPPTGPFTLFIWGVSRILPVRVEEFSITEDAHDIALNPLRAKVSLGLRVLSYNDLSLTNPGYYMFLAHQVVKEAMAVVGTVQNVSAVAGGELKLI